MRVVFPYIGQIHQIPHSLPIAAEISTRYPEVQVHVSFVSDEQEQFGRHLIQSYSPKAPLHFRRLRLSAIDLWRVRHGLSPWKQLTLYMNRDYFGAFDALVTPEQTTLILRHLLSKTQLIWTRHGAGDRSSGFASRVRHFDFVLLSGPKIERALRDRGLIRTGRYAGGVYAKFDWLRRKAASPPRFFDNGRPTVLYNPHFRPKLSSWGLMGRQILNAFAASVRYNLIFAPHMRMINSFSRDDLALFQRLRDLPHFRIDLGSELSIDMSYTSVADFYLGDVSSQIAEFLIAPKPCLFLNAHHVIWESDPAYHHWTLGPVTTSVAEIEEQVKEAIRSHDRYRAVQEAYVQESFGDALNVVSSSARGADAIVTYLASNHRVMAAPISEANVRNPAFASVKRESPQTHRPLGQPDEGPGDI